MASSSHPNQRLHADALLVNGTARRAMGDSECLAPLTLAIELAGQLGENELLARALTELCSLDRRRRLDGWTTQYAPRSTPRLRWTFRRPGAPRCWLPDRCCWRCQSTRAGHEACTSRP